MIGRLLAARFRVHLVIDNSCTTTVSQRPNGAVVCLLVAQMTVPLHKHCINTSSNLIIADMSGLAKPRGANRVNFAID